jgi:DNA-binding response OmpR family regulator
MVRRGLETAGFSVDVASTGEDGNDKAGRSEYDAVILDAAFDGDRGLSALRRWRNAGIQTHILVLARHGGAGDKVQSLDLGADDCLARPFDLKELLARLRALTRRGPQGPSSVLRILDLEIDRTNRSVRRAGQPVHLTRREYDLLDFLVSHRGRVVTRTMIRDHLYDGYEEDASNVVDVYIRYLRKKIDNGTGVQLILTRWGEGYFLRGDET